MNHSIISLFADQRAARLKFWETNMDLFSTNRKLDVSATAHSITGFPPLVKNSFVGHASGDRLIRALMAEDKGSGFYAMTFPETEVQGVAQVGQDRSALVLRSGVKIPVALSYEDLEQKIFTPNFRTYDGVLDLRDVTGEAARPKATANTNRAPEPGDRMPDGTIYAGVSPDTGKAMYAMPEDAYLSMTFNKAQKYAAKLDAHGHQDWHVPTKAELNVLFNNRAAIGGFNVTGSYPAGWYRSSSQNGIWGAWDQRFRDGCQSTSNEISPSSVRCVR